MSDRCAKCGKALVQGLRAERRLHAPPRMNTAWLCPDRGENWRWRECKFGGKPVPAIVGFGLPARICIDRSRKALHGSVSVWCSTEMCASCSVPAQIADRNRYRKMAGRLAEALRVASRYHYPDEAKKRRIANCPCADCEVLRDFEKMEVAP